MTQRTVAIIGAGYMAEEHAKAFAACDGVTIAGIHSRTRARAQALADTCGARVFDSVEALWQGTRADIVVVAVPELAAKSICEAAFRHPWVCLLEKPVGYDLDDALKIAASAKAQDARAFVGFNRRCHSSTRQMMAALASDDGPRLITVLDQQSLEAARAAGQPEEIVQTWMYANSIHLVDYLAHVGRGQITDIAVTAPWSADAPGVVMATVTFDSGDIGLYQAVWNGPAPWVVTVGTPSNRFDMRPLETLTIQPQGQRRAIAQDIDAVDSDFKPGLKHQADEVLRFLDTGNCDLADIAASTRSMKLVAALYGLAEIKLPL